MVLSDPVKTALIVHGMKTIEIELVAEADVQPTCWRPTRLVFSGKAAFGAPSFAAYAILGALVAPFAAGTVVLTVQGDLLTAGFLFFLLAGLVSVWVWWGIRNASQVRFDKTTSLVTVRFPDAAFRAPLRNVVAVQVVPGQRVQVLPFFGRTAYQLNVILDDPNLFSITLSYCPSRDWTRKIGKQLAEFLVVPLVDQCTSQ